MPPLFVTALCLVGYGLVAALLPCGTATVGEVIDTPGSRDPPSDIEPTGWNVVATRLSGVVSLACGLYLWFGWGGA
jgi:hypothetical protein